MKQYKSSRIVHAEPMTQGKWQEKHTQIEIQKEADPNAAGYHVIYSKGTLDEYQTWSPKKMFDDNYAEWNDFNFDEPDICETCSS